MEKRTTIGASKMSGPDTRPSFNMIMYPATLTDLQIPPSFKKHLMDEEAHDHATIRSFCGSWEVEILQDGIDTYLVDDGWKEFVDRHSLGAMERLIFKYNGNMCFDVDIFDNNGCLKKHLPLVTTNQESASSFVSQFPYFKLTMKSYNIGWKSSLLIPKAFSRVHLPLSEPKRIVLRKSNGMCWSVTIVVKSTKEVVISGGWKSFSDANSLKIGDTCIFELVDEEKMQVHVYKSV